MQNLTKYMEDCDLPINDEPILDGTIHRYSARPEKPLDKDEWYIGWEEDGSISCVFYSWRFGDGSFYYSSNGYQKPSKEERERIQKARQESQKIRNEEYKIAADEVSTLCASLPLCESHPYLTKKKVSTHGIRQDGDNLFIPVNDISGNPTSAEYISPDSKKWSYKGGKRAFGMYIIGKPSNRILVCEGFATAATLYEATGICTVAAFTSGNVAGVGMLIKNKYSDSSVELCADLGSAGEKSIRKWKELVSKTVHYPEFSRIEQEQLIGIKNLDFNDMLQFSDNKAIVDIINKCYRPEGFFEHYNREKRKFTWIVEDLLSEGSINMLYGGEGVGKSLISFNLGFCLACGVNFLTWNIPTKKKVLVIDGEMGGDEIDMRIEDILTRYNPEGAEEEILPSDEFFKIISLDKIILDGQKTIDLFSVSSHAMLNDAIEDADVIIFDHLTALSLSGDSGEETLNSSASWNKINEWFKVLKNKGKTIIYIHHKNKNDDATGTRAMKTNPLVVIRLDSVPELDNPDTKFMIDFVIEKGRHIHGINRLTKRFVLDSELCDKQYKGKVLGGWVRVKKPIRK